MIEGGVNNDGGVLNDDRGGFELGIFTNTNTLFKKTCITAVS